MGFIIRLDDFGVTSFVRWLFLTPECYEPMVRFFRCSSWSIETLLARWAILAANRYPLVEFNGRALMIGDGIKVVKEAHKMPAVKSLHQDSDNSGKPSYMRGHHFGFAGLLVGSLSKAFCLALQGRLHEGIEPFRPSGSGKRATLVTRMAHWVVQKAIQMNRLCYVTLDAYFSTGPAFRIFKEAVNEKGEQLVHLVTRAKDNYVAYFNTNEKKFLDADKIPPMAIFNYPKLFEKAELAIYGQVKTIEYLDAQFLWKPIGDLLSFVCVKDGNKCYILMCSDLTLAATDIIIIYSHRCKIELMFPTLKHVLGGFGYHFWSKAFPKLSTAG